MYRFPIVCMNYIKLLIGLLVLLMADVGLSADSAPWRSAVVSHVTDADTLWVRVDGRSGKPLKLRILSIDAPEICQAGGPEAKRALEQFVLGRRVEYASSWHDGYGRALAEVRVDGADVGAWLVRRGLAWSYGFHRIPGRYASEQLAAMRESKGVFAAAHPMEPRLFRRTHGPCT